MNTTKTLDINLLTEKKNFFDLHESIECLCYHRSPFPWLFAPAKRVEVLQGISNLILLFPPPRFPIHWMLNVKHPLNGINFLSTIILLIYQRRFFLPRASFEASFRCRRVISSLPPTRLHVECINGG